MKLVYGTYNPAKYDSMVQIVEDLEIELISLSSFGKQVIESDESGNDPLSNAEEKALNYYKQIKKPVFSCDTGLYFRGVKECDQPGVKARRVNGKKLNDIEMMNHYISIADKYGGKLVAYYTNAICLVMDKNNIIRDDGDDLNSEEFYIVNKPHPTVREGFPLDSISVHIEKGKYYYDIGDDQQNNFGVSKGIHSFFKRLIQRRQDKNEC
ncbi:inosine/xanthosine triphosphate pyrophosphatase family protein [Halanaerobium saccharolyticum]|uniref:Inosine/xanthosine triphosphate pyrophosphatase family protein n=1 Tax=Halanaerobium saccharolyticum TaxID=43595 RepID=A0A4R6LFP8_9FIRM|nr:non-canonical purine NTP pyrophosphatase [Halanaerobium saccharolyticum]TDO73409.1 inosine/xanthosine triphosphate pyrophosphatase family protein [Halanaerobium saccharolyticum]